MKSVYVAYSKHNVGDTVVPTYGLQHNLQMGVQSPTGSFKKNIAQYK